MSSLPVGTTLYGFVVNSGTFTPKKVYSTNGLSVSGKGLYDIYGNNLDLWVDSRYTEAGAGNYGQGDIYVFDSSSYTWGAVYPVLFDRNSALDTTVQEPAYFSKLSDGGTEYFVKDSEALRTSDIVSSVSSSSDNTKAVGAKLFYDTCGDIETLINAL